MKNSFEKTIQNTFKYQKMKRQELKKDKEKKNGWLGIQSEVRESLKFRDRKQKTKKQKMIIATE